MNMKQNEWFDATIGDDTTYARYNGKREFEFISNMWLDVCEGDEGYPDKTWCVRHDIFDLNDYDEHDLEMAAAFNYGSMEYFKSLGYSQEDEDYLMAESMFWGYPGDDSVGGMFTEQESIDYIENYIKEN